jgi:pantoate--beta-alanine ligase
VGLVFVPSVADLYPPGRSVTVAAGPVGSVLEGASRPGHFDGVLTVVLKLFNLVRPDLAVFGQKDAQQLACIRRMVADLNVGVEIVGAPTVREPDGLALSSRNRYLSASERRSARAISAALRSAAQHATAQTVLDALRAELAAAEAGDPAFRLDYADLVSPGTFSEVGPDYTGEAVLAVAAYVGKTRLIDNVTVRLGAGPR